MVIEEALPPFSEWLPSALGQWLLVLALLAGGAIVLSYLFMALRYGPLNGGERVARTLVGGLGDLLRISPRRAWALTRLAVQESLHRRVLVVFFVFVLVLLFAGWYLDPQSTNLARLYLSVVLTTTSYLVLLLSLFLSVFSLPNDIAKRTIHTVVTKPVRPSEIVLGRMAGFTLIGTVLLLVTGTISYVFVVRGLRHTHEIRAADLEPVSGQGSSASSEIAMRGQTTRVQGHRHEVFLDANGNGYTDRHNGHWHEITTENRAGRKVYVVGPSRGGLTARVPVYGKLRFINRRGEPSEKGVNVGHEWTYRSYIDGGTLAAAIWTFQGLSAELFPDHLPLELNLRVFRTHKGKIERGILGSIVLRNPDRPEVASAPRQFIAKEFQYDLHKIPLELEDDEGRVLHVFKDLVTSDGRLEVVIQCLEGGQYFGMAQPDVYLRARDASFAWNFVKGYLGIWMQMLVLTAVGVMFSTFLSSPVAMMATLATMLGGFFTRFISQLALGELPGGGPFEALYRLLTQSNLKLELEPGLKTDIIHMSDQAAQWILRRVVTLLPDLTRMSDVDYVANGFDIPSNLLAVQIASAFGYAVPIFVVAFFLFKTREVAR